MVTTLQSSNPQLTIPITLTDLTPDYKALRLLRSQQAYAWRVLPLGWQGEYLRVAVAQPPSAAQLRLFSQITGWPVEPVLCSAIDLEIALARYYSGPTVPRSHLRPVTPLYLLRALDLVPGSVLREALGQQSRGGSDWLEWLLTNRLLSSAQGAALRAVEQNRPYLRSARFDSHPGLALLLPATLAAKWSVVPFYADSRRIWVYIPAGRPLTTPEELAHSVGLEVLPVVVEQSHWDDAFMRLYNEQQTAARPLRPINDILREGDWLSEEQKAQALDVSSRNGITIAALAREQGWLTTAQWRQVEARRFGFLPLYEDLPGDRASLEGLRFAEDFGRQWSIVPLAVRDGTLHVGLAQTAQQRFLPVIEAIAHLPLQVYLLDKVQFARAWNVYYDSKGLFDDEKMLADLPIAPPGLAEWLLAGSYLTSDQLQRALAFGRETEGSLLDTLLAFGLLDPTDTAEVVSLQSGLPWFPLDRVPRQLTLTERQALQIDMRLIALLDFGRAPNAPRTVLVAVADPLELEAVAEWSGDLRLQPLIVPRNVLRLAAEVVDGAYQVDEFLRYLVQQELLSPPSVPIVAARVAEGQPIDQALMGDVADPRDIYRALAAFNDLSLMSLTPDYRQEMILDALGRVKRRTTVHDPLQPTPYQLTLLEAQQWAAVVVAEEEGRLTIAVADPLNASICAAIEAAVVPRRVSWVVAPRDEILEAIMRRLGRKNIGTHLLEAGLITAGALDEALRLAQKAGVRVGQSLVLLGHISREELVSFLARQQDMPFVDLDHAMIEPEVARLLSERDARLHGVLPLAADDESVTVAMVDPLDSEALAAVQLLLGKTVHPTITTEDAFESALEFLYHDEYTYRSTKELIFRYPEESAFQVLTRPQKIVFAAIGVVSLLALLWNAVGFLIFVNALASIFYLTFSAHRFYLVYRALSNDLEVPVSTAETDALQDRDLPIYTILIPLYKEAAVLPKLTRSLTRLDYPLAKLDVKLLLEANDHETIAAARALDLPLNFEHVIVPDSLPKTKPKACNYGLIKAKGEFVVIYDAEDIPDADQLKKAVVAFEKVGPQVACMQAKLNYFNRDQNLLTRWFTIEYSMWFDLFLPGLDASGAPVPLGGTSNHFRRHLLESLGAWDPFNVTEDADLGVRLYKAGYKTAIIDSTTFEEANSQVGNWIRQRSRWVKGYIQTWLVHMRHPITFLNDVGLKAFLGFNLTIGGTFLGFLLNPLYWLLTAIWFLTEWNVVQQTFPPAIYYIGAINLFIGNFAYTYMNVAGSLRREFYDMVKYALLSPIYWVLMSIGAWKGFIQLIHKPFYWEKTVHGLDKGMPNMTKANKLKDLI